LLGTTELPWRTGSWQFESVDLVGPCEVHPAASDDADVELARSVHQLVRTATGVNDCTRVAVKSMQRWSPFPELAAHTMALSLPFVVVTQGDP
jgi:hypothetical protein